MATPELEYPAVRLGLLVNGRSASAAEIVAAALREHGKAVLIGEQSYGKCSVQSVYQIFGDGAVWGALKLTTKRYFTPGGTSLSDGGLAVDVAVKQEDEELAPLLALWQESLRRSWNDPTRLRSSLLDVEGDTCLREALAVVADPGRYEKLLAGTATEEGGAGRPRARDSGDQ
jgi:hypothetical protein